MDALAFVIPFLGLIILFSLFACKLVRNFTEIRGQDQQTNETTIEINSRNNNENNNNNGSKRLQKIQSIDTVPTGIKIAFMPTGQLMYAKPTLSEMSVGQVNAGSDSFKNLKLSSQDSGVVMYRTEISLSIQSGDFDDLKPADSILSQHSMTQNNNSQIHTLSQQSEFSSNNR
eukprot:TRINITY_DN50601_c0_g1_i1.p2 TRINITY_DN50601_c0_g1~~TRINITY_DN50601_c0_g1_i1.p2  ORF type:complete len:195 (-),score=24.69 TRINITY_DN50601_c0_g1_i1:250-768(-)